MPPGIEVCLRGSASRGWLYFFTVFYIVCCQTVLLVGASGHEFLSFSVCMCGFPRGKVFKVSASTRLRMVESMSGVDPCDPSSLDPSSAPRDVRVLAEILVDIIAGRAGPGAIVTDNGTYAQYIDTGRPVCHRSRGKLYVPPGVWWEIMYERYKRGLPHPPGRVYLARRGYMTTGTIRAERVLIFNLLRIFGLE